MGTESYAVGMAQLYWMSGTTQASVNALYNGLKAATKTIAAPGFSFGDIVAGEIAPAITYLDHFVSVRGDKRKDKSVAVQKAITIPFTFDEINATNVSRFLFGAAAGTAKYSVMGATTVPVEGSCILYFTTAIGRSFMYVVPRAALKTDGGLPFSMDGWMQAKFSLEVLYHSSFLASPVSGAYSCPYGFIDFANIATVGP